MTPQLARPHVLALVERLPDLAVGLDDQLVATRAATWPRASGRDIKALARPVATFCRHNEAAPTLEAFARCAMFRALDAEPAGAA